MKKIYLIIISIFLLAFIIPQEQKKGEPWVIPDKYSKMINTINNDQASLAVGKMLWTKHCKSCHGNIGKGDGPKSKMMKTFPGDFSTVEFKNNKDGVLYYKAFVGRNEMPNFEKLIPNDEDRWSLINHIRSLSKY